MFCFSNADAAFSVKAKVISKGKYRVSQNYVNTNGLF